MPSKKQYNLVQNDENDTRIPLHPEEAFQHGIMFQAKFIGSLDVPRPVSRVEIVAAMRRIRYEFKAKGVKKKKVTVEVSIDGVRVNLRKKKKKNQWMDENKMLLMHHPIYRIFYVSHDSQDLKIFSYIARDGASNVFKCNVFKSNKKSQAMRIVRTVGQAFEVCHKLSINIPASVDDEHDPLNDVEDGNSERGSDILGDQPKKAETSSDPISCETLPGEDSVSTQDTDGLVLSTTPVSQRPLRLDIVPPSPAANSNRRSSPLSGVDAYVSPSSEALKSSGEQMPNSGTLLSGHHEIQLLKEQLNQQSQQTQAAVAQVHLLRDQLAAETAARLEAQARTHQLLVHNKELLDHITALVAHLQEQERTQKPLQMGGQNVAMMPQYFCDPLYLPEVQDADQTFGENRNTVNHGQFVTAPSSPKQRQSTFFQGQQQQQGYSFMFPTPEQQFQAQLIQRLQNLTGYKNHHPYSILAPGIYQPLPSGLYSFPNTFPHVKSYKSPPATKAASSVDVAAAEDNAERLEQEADEERYPQPLSRLDAHPPSKKNTLPEPHDPRSGGSSSPAAMSRRKGRVETEPINIPQPAKAAATTQSPPKNQPQSPKSPYQNAFQSALSSLMALRMTGGGADRTKKQSQSNGPSFITRSTSEKVPNRSELMDQLSPTAKVFRWFKLVPPPTHSLSRPESGFVDGEKSQKDGDDDGIFKVDDVFDQDAILERSLLRSLSSRKRKRLLKLHLGRMTTF